jgi:hypothetical protein
MEHNLTILKVGFGKKAYCCSCGITIYGRTFPGTQMKTVHIMQQVEQERWMKEFYKNRYQNMGE